MIRNPKVLVLTDDGNEVIYLRQALKNHATLAHARDLSQMSRHLEKDGYDVVFCAWTFYKAFWNDALLPIRERYPELPVVIVSRNGGEREWLEVLNAGAFDAIDLRCPQPALFALLEHAATSHEARKTYSLSPAQP